VLLKLHEGNFLKQITAKNLALASQALGLFIELIPGIKGRLQLKFKSSKDQPLLGDFDRVLTIYTNHRAEIYTKFFEIMQSTFSACFLNFEVIFCLT